MRYFSYRSSLVINNYSTFAASRPTYRGSIYRNEESPDTIVQYSG